jgi:hypothetical protein
METIEPAALGVHFPFVRKADGRCSSLVSAGLRVLRAHRLCLSPRLSRGRSTVPIARRRGARVRGAVRMHATSAAGKGASIIATMFGPGGTGLPKQRGRRDGYGCRETFAFFEIGGADPADL